MNNKNKVKEKNKKESLTHNEMRERSTKRKE